MRREVLWRRGACLICLIFWFSPALGSDYSPDLAEFAGDAAWALATQDELSFEAGGTVEFWVAAEWQSPPDVSPVVVAGQGVNRLNFAIAISPNKDQLFVYAGDQSAALSADFSKGEMRHVSIASLDDQINVLVDGTLLGRLSFALPADAVTTLWVGGLDETQARFQGAIAQLRVWDTVLVPEELADFAMADESAVETPHPSISALRVRSEFAARQLKLLPFEPVPVELELE